MDILKIENSSQIVAVAYDAAAPALFIEFKPALAGRSVYRYADAQASMMDRIREINAAGESVGSFVARSVKPVFSPSEVRRLTQEEIDAFFPAPVAREALGAAASGDVVTE